MWHGGRDFNDSGEPILLLEPSSVSSQEVAATHHTCSSSVGAGTGVYGACNSYLGGHAVYYPKDEHYSLLSNPKPHLQSQSQLKCQVCNDDMYLLLQLYAPLDALHRTLYVFACNKASCIQHAFKTINNDNTSNDNNSNDDVYGNGNHRFSLGGCGVIKCFRSQCSSSHNIHTTAHKADDTGTSVISDKCCNDGHGSHAKNTAIDRWGTDYDSLQNKDDQGWGDNYIAWGDNDNDDNHHKDTHIDTNTVTNSSHKTNISMDDLEAMLSAMEANIDNDYSNESRKSGKKKIKKNLNKNNNNSDTRTYTDNHDNLNNSKSSYQQPSFKKINLETYDEPVSNNITMNHRYKNDFNNSVDGSYDDEDDNIGITYKDDITIQKMLSSYLNEEEDEGIKAVIQTYDNRNNHNSNSHSCKSSSINGEKEERLSPEDRAFFTFTDRIKRSPNQCVRYAYDGLPLWSIPISLTPKGKKGRQCRDLKFPTVSRCKCGSERKFEFQVLPSILHLLEVDKYYYANKTYSESHNSQHNNSYSYLEDELNKNEGGMNWGMIAIYSCPNSCNQSYEEFVVLQESVDSNPQKMVFVSTKNNYNNNSNGDSDES